MSYTYQCGKCGEVLVRDTPLGTGFVLCSTCSACDWNRLCPQCGAPTTRTQDGTFVCSRCPWFGVNLQYQPTHDIDCDLDEDCRCMARLDRDGRKK